MTEAQRRVATEGYETASDGRQKYRISPIQETVARIFLVRTLEVAEQASPIDRRRLSFDRFLFFQSDIVGQTADTSSAAGACLFEQCSLIQDLRPHGAPPEPTSRGLPA